MTGKCCRDCVYFTEMQGVTTPECSKLDINLRAKGLIPDIFYCSSFSRRNSAKTIGQKEDNVEEETLPPIQRRFV